MLNRLFITTEKTATPLYIIHTLDDLPLKNDASPLEAFQKNWLTTQPIKTQLKGGEVICMPNLEGGLAFIAVSRQQTEPFFTLGTLYDKLPNGTYKLMVEEEGERFQLLLGFALGAYRYDRYKAAEEKTIRFLATEKEQKKITQAASAHYLVRDLINEPPNSLTPDNFAREIQAIFSELPVKQKEIVGEALLRQNFPLIYTVGAGSKYNPRLIEVLYGDFENHPNVTLVGKGITFDTGGLDIKPSSGMRLMKKDMGGAAHVIALTKWLIESEAPLAIRLLVPIAENAISSHAMRPSDIVKARNGLTVEIDNTDAEGRLILADTLAYASEQDFDLLLNFATLTGAARVALGPELPALFSTDEALTELMINQGRKMADLLWPMPFHEPYKEWIEAKTVDLLNASIIPQGGAITAALFLKSFVDNKNPFLHLDLMAYNIRDRAGRPKGGEAMGLRAAYFAILNYFNIAS